MTGIRSFHDLPLWAKVLLAPAACVVAGVAVAVSIWLGAVETEGRLAEVAGRALPTAAASVQLLDDLDTIQTKAMRAMVWQEAGVAPATIDSLVADIGRAMTALRGTAAAMVAARAEGDADLPRLRSIAVKAADYTKQLGDALDLSERGVPRWGLFLAGLPLVVAFPALFAFGLTGHSANIAE